MGQVDFTMPAKEADSLSHSRLGSLQDLSPNNAAGAMTDRNAGNQQNKIKTNDEGISKMENQELEAPLPKKSRPIDLTIKDMLKQVINLLSERENLKLVTEYDKIVKTKTNEAIANKF